MKPLGDRTCTRVLSAPGDYPVSSDGAEGAGAHSQFVRRQLAYSVNTGFFSPAIRPVRPNADHADLLRYGGPCCFVYKADRISTRQSDCRYSGAVASRLAKHLRRFTQTQLHHTSGSCSVHVGAAAPSGSPGYAASAILPLRSYTVHFVPVVPTSIPKSRSLLFM